MSFTKWARKRKASKGQKGRPALGGLDANGVTPTRARPSAKIPASGKPPAKEAKQSGSSRKQAPVAVNVPQVT